MSQETINNPDYLQHHPNAIQDMNEAHELASSSNELESERALLVGAVALAGESYSSRVPTKDIVVQRGYANRDTHAEKSSAALIYATSDTLSDTMATLNSRENRSHGTPRISEHKPLTGEEFSKVAGTVSEKVAKIDEQLTDVYNKNTPADNEVAAQLASLSSRRS